jgi:hypothetical protein
MQPIKDQLPRIFQANLARFFDRVVRPGLAALPVHGKEPQAEAASLAEALDRAAARVDNYTANEAAKAFALTLAALFERQLSIWARAIEAEDAAAKPKAISFEVLLGFCAAQAGIDLGEAGLGDCLVEMFVGANVVRHGEGPSCARLRAVAPALWDDDLSDYADLLAGPPLPSEHLRVREQDLIRYIRAATRFWGLADPLPMAVVDPPY